MLLTLIVTHKFEFHRGLRLQIFLSLDDLRRAQVMESSRGRKIYCLRSPLEMDLWEHMAWISPPILRMNPFLFHSAAFLKNRLARMKSRGRRGCSQLVHIVHKGRYRTRHFFSPFANKMNNLRTVGRLGVDKFISSALPANVFAVCL